MTTKRMTIRSTKLTLVLVAALLLLETSVVCTDPSSRQGSDTLSYGIDVSFPVQGQVSRENSPLGNRQKEYIRHLEGCREACGPAQSYLCDTYEYDRLIMNRRQPQSMVNLTKTGFQTIRAPSHLKELIDDFWEKNKDRRDEKPENWGKGNVYVNHWDNPTTLVSVDDKGLRGSGAVLKENIWAAASAVIEEWSHEELQPCSLYGIRVYHEGNIMLPHVDRLPLVASAIISVAQDLDEPWPLVSHRLVYFSFCYGRQDPCFLIFYLTCCDSRLPERKK